VLDKPRKITRSYACWRGTPEHLVEIARVVQNEIERATQAAIQMAFREIDETLSRQREEARTALRTQAGLTAGAPDTPQILAQLATMDANTAPLRQAQRQGQERFIRDQASRSTFAYADELGQVNSSNDPESLRRIKKTDSINMRGYVLGTKSNASISVLIQNRPWETVSLDVEGEDPDWVSAATAPIHAQLSLRESRVVKVLRNEWLRNAIGVALWMAFIPPIEGVFRKYTSDTLFAVPIALVLAGIAVRAFQFFTKPLVITRREPNAWAEIGKAAISPAASAAATYLLNRFLSGFER
jgi:hypothetical protein